jgi:hypothetical protein
LAIRKGLPEFSSPKRETFSTGGATFREFQACEKLFRKNFWSDPPLCTVPCEVQIIFSGEVRKFCSRDLPKAAPFHSHGTIMMDHRDFAASFRWSTGAKLFASKLFI